MHTELTKYHVWLFINGKQVGDNHTFADWYEDDAAAIADAREYFTGEGYEIESITAEEREVWPVTPLSAAVSGKVLTVSLITPAKPC